MVAGVVLSTLHQSSLGTLYLIVPGKLHELWYTAILPVQFFVSAIAVGLAMVIVESHLSSRAFGRQLEMPLLTTVGRALAGVLGVYAVIRVFDLLQRGVLGSLANLSYESNLALLELVPFLALPLVLLFREAVRRSPRWLYGSALLVVAGFITNRLNVAITGFEGAQGGHYVPSWAEAGITLFIVALGFGAFAFAVKHLNVYPAEDDERGPEPAADAAAAAALPTAA